MKKKSGGTCGKEEKEIERRGVKNKDGKRKGEV
jgi:hypothetical protein